MSDFELILRRATTPASDDLVDIGIVHGAIATIEPEIGGTFGREIDLTGARVLPGGIDAHVHFNEPGRTDWEGWASGSAASITGGVTSVFEMPLNAHPPTLDRASFEAKLAAARASSWVDFGLWGGLTPDSLDTLPELHEAGVIGFKAFMSASGTDDFRYADADTLHRGMEFAASVGQLVAVHAEDNAMVAAATVRARADGRTSMRDYLDSRTIDAELAAITTAISLAEETGCRLHIVHVSTPEGVDLVTDARRRTIDVTCETCAHYLVLCDDDAVRIGALAKCAPPLRSAEAIAGLWDRLRDGSISFVTSDHSPAPPSMKTSSDAFEVWGGISGCQHLVPVTLTAARQRDFAWTDLANLLSDHVAKRFGIPAKGVLEVGADADLVVVAPQPAAPIPPSAIRYRHPASAFDGTSVEWQVTHTILRGQVIVANGAIVAGRSNGRLIRPSQTVSS